MVTRPSCALLTRGIVSLGVLAVSIYAAAETDRRPIRAADVVEMRDLAEPDIKDVRLRRYAFARSPDGALAAFVTRRGVLATNRVLYELHLYRLDELRSALRSELPFTQWGSQPAVAFESSAGQLFEHAIRSLAWLPDSQSLSFVGEASDKESQVYRLDVGTRQLIRCTNHPHPIVSFAYGRRDGPLVFAAIEPVAREEEGIVQIVAGNRSLQRLVSPPPPHGPGLHYRLYSAAACDEAPPKALSEPFAGFLPPQLWLSPAGDQLLTRLPVHDPAKAARWIQQYEALEKSSFFSQYAATADDYFTRSDSPGLSQFVMFDLVSNRARPLFDAPDGFMIGGVGIDAAWAGSKGHSVLLGNTFLPLDGVASKERLLRSGGPFVVEVDVRSHKVTRIRDLLPRSGPGATVPATNSYSGLKLDSSGLLTLHFSGNAEPETYRKSGARWQHANENANVGSSADLSLFVRQSANSAPDIAARLEATGAERVISDLNPRFRDLTFARAEVVTWNVGERQHSGTLLYPLGYRDGRRYPVVMQVYAIHDTNEFMIDGPLRFSSAFAAQPLAAAGFAVLTLGFEGDVTTRAGLIRSQRAIEAAIDHFVARGLVDGTKVGLIGFSASGVVVQQTITFSTYPIAAATIADAWAHSLFGYTAYLFGYTRPGMLFAENLMEARPWGPELQTWIERDPSLHTDQIEAAVRLEQYGAYVNPYWDIYALMRRQHKPVELIVIRDGKHQLRLPQQRLASLQGNVDWFRYWLKGECDSDASQGSHCLRWSKMREMQEAAHQQQPSGQ